MKRPLMWLCAVLFLLAAVYEWQEETKGVSPAFQIMNDLEQTFADETQLNIQGNICERELQPMGMRYKLNNLSIQTDNSVFSIPEKYQFIFSTNDKKYLLPGDRVTLKATIHYFEPSSNPGEFNVQKWYLSENIIGRLSNPDLIEILSGAMSVRRVLEQIRTALCRSFLNIMERTEAETVSAITYGEKLLLDDEDKRLYQEGGIAHIFSVSGLHISLFGMSIYLFLRKLCGRIGFCAALSLLCSSLYVLMTGCSLSACRAEIMFVIWLGAQICGRKYDMLTSIMVTLLLFVIEKPQILSESSFWLSFGAVLSMGLLFPLLKRMYGSKFSVMNSVYAGISIWLGMLPVNLFFFYQTSPWSIFLNLIVLPLTGSFFLFGILASCAGLLSVSLGVFLGAPAGYLTQIIAWLCEQSQKLPESVLVCGRPEWCRILLYYVLLILVGVLVYRKEKGIGRYFFPIVIFTCWQLMQPVQSEELQIICLDVGQGDCSLLHMPSGENYLIDGGSTSKSNVWGNILEKTVKYQGIRCLDGIFLSHADEDHISAISEYLETYEKGFHEKNIHGITLKQLILPLVSDKSDFHKLKELAQRCGIEIVEISAGQELLGDEWSFRCLSPAEGELTGDRNEDSMVLKIVYHNFSMLFTGDLEGKKEQELISKGSLLQANVLKAGHHGSANASSAEFLKTVSPDTAIISCGKNNIYGHPAADTMDRLKAAGCKVFQTQHLGAIMIRSDGEQYTIAGWKQ